MKITVYAICKNESAFVKRWVDSMSEADQICVLDTGSTDDTVALLENAGVKVKQKRYELFRFDKARNDSLKEVDEDSDVCVCTDLDEVFSSGWRKEIERLWKDKTEKLLYTYHWQVSENNEPLVSFYGDKIHSRRSWKWKYPVHEVLTRTNVMPFSCKKSNIELIHLPDKQKSRTSYLPLLELCCKEYPNDNRSWHYLGREYAFYGSYEKAISCFNKYLDMPCAFNEEKSMTYRYMAECYRNLSNSSEAEKCLIKAISQTPSLREPYVDYATFLMDEKDFYGAIHFLNKALLIDTPSLAFAKENTCYSALPYDLLSICYYELKDVNNAHKCALKALSYGENERIRKNLEEYFS